MIFKRKYFFVVLVEFSIFILNHQAPLGGRLYVMRLPPPEYHVVGVVGKIDTKRSTTSEQPVEPAVSVHSSLHSHRTENESKRDVEAVQGISVTRHNTARTAGRITSTINIHSRSKPSTYFNFQDVKGRWPAGTYGLPRATSGCPSADGFTWKTGHRFHDTEDDGTENLHSDSFHLAGNFSDEGIRHEFCIKTDELGHGRWPEGKYCLYKKGARCPAGLEKGFVIWDDENKDNQNSAGGELPEGQYSDDTKIYFCCSTSGSVEQPIALPNDRPFLLFAYESIKCQNVKGMTAKSEFIKFDDEDRGNIDYEGGEYPYGIHKAEKDHMFFLCYYTPIKEDKKKEKEDDVYRPSPTPRVDKLEQLEKLKKSEKMMDAFLTSVKPINGESNKNERTKTIIKTIRVPERVRDGNTSIIVTTFGIIFGAILMVLAAALVVSRHMRARQEGIRVDTLEDTQFNGSSRRSSFTTTEDEVDLLEGDYEEDELVEDQYLPSDSELKSGLELMFLKQQRHYWTRKKRP